MGHPFEGWSNLNENWDSGNPTEFSDLTAAIGTIGKNFLGPVALALVILWSVKALLSLAVGSLYIIAQVAGIQAIYTVGSALSWAGYPVLFIVGLIQMSLYRPIQLQAFEGRAFVGGLGDAIRLAKDVAPKVAVTTLLYGLSMMIGVVGCGLGMLVAFFFFCQAPYLAATTELSPLECMRRSYELSKAYYMPVLAAVVASLAMVSVLGGCGGALLGFIGGLLMQVSPGAGSLVISLGTDLTGLLSAAGTLVFSGAMFTAIQAAERGRSIV